MVTYPSIPPSSSLHSLLHKFIVLQSLIGEKNRLLGDNKINKIHDETKTNTLESYNTNKKEERAQETVTHTFMSSELP